jgi:parallel beta-helix repeat protein
VVVRDNYVHDNVAGLEIENTINGEVYKNVARGNTGGMLIFDMPDLPQANGDKIKFYDNLMENNNSENFAPKGMVVSTIPPGSGMIIMAHSNIEAHHNIIKGHKTLGIAINSWLFTGVPFESKNYDPYSTNISIHDNQITETNGPTDNTTEYGQLMTSLLGGKAYDIVIDGIFKPESMGVEGRVTSYCFTNNGDISFVNLNGGKGATPAEMAKNMDNDLSKFNCTLPEFDTKDHNAWLLAAK